MRSIRKLRVNVAVTTLAAATVAFTVAATGARWSAAERTMLASLTLSNLPPLEADPSNRWADDTAAASLGRALFFDARLSQNGKVSCGSCHQAEKEFQDGTALASGVGTTARRTMPVAGSAHSAWFFWDGRSDSQWSQALGPLESPVEHGGDRTQYAHIVAAYYRAPYERVFGALPSLTGLPDRAGPVPDSIRRIAWERIPPARQDDITRVYANIGKAIAAFERRIEHSPTRFDRYVEAELAGRAHTPESAFTSEEEAGLRLFIGKANCVNCHNGPRFTDEHFHNTGVAASPRVSSADSGRATGVRQVVSGEFNCLSRYSDARPEQCAELQLQDAVAPRRRGAGALHACGATGIAGGRRPALRSGRRSACRPLRAPPVAAERSREGADGRLPPPPLGTTARQILLSGWSQRC